MNNIIWNSNSNMPRSQQKGSSNNICRIFVDPNIQPKIKLDDLFVSDNNNEYASNKDGVGISYPVIAINNYIITSEEIDYMEIACENLLPSIFLQITTTSENLLFKDPPKDGDIISVFIRTTTDVITPLRCDFIIKNNNKSEKIKTTVPATNTMILNGVLFVPGILSEAKSFAAIGTSIDVIKKIATKLKLGFATNEQDMLNDTQLWINPKNSLKNFINEITQHSWLDEQNFYKTWIDIYYNLNFINVNKMLMSSDDEVDITAFSSIQDVQKMYPINTGEEASKATPKIFTNVFNDMRSSPFYVMEWVPYNQSSKITEKYGSTIITHEFFHNQNLYNSKTEPFITLNNTQMYDPNKIDTHILLRGRTTYDPNIADINEMAHENINTDDINTHTTWSGIQYVMSEEDAMSNDNLTWSGNVHKNYNRAKIHNLLNNKELDKMYITITVAGPCLQVMRGEKVPVILNYSPGITQQTINNSTGINKLYSGMYFVDSYKIIYKHQTGKSGDAGFSAFNTEFTLKRREWPIPVDAQKE